MHYLQHYLPDTIVKKVLSTFWHNNEDSNIINSDNYAINEKSD